MTVKYSLSVMAWGAAMGFAAPVTTRYLVQSDDQVVVGWAVLLSVGFFGWISFVLGFYHCNSSRPFGWYIVLFSCTFVAAAVLTVGGPPISPHIGHSSAGRIVEAVGEIAMVYSFGMLLAAFQEYRIERRRRLLKDLGTSQ